MSSNRSSEFEIFTDSQFPNKNLQDREYFEDFVLLIADSVSIHFLFENQIETRAQSPPPPPPPPPPPLSPIVPRSGDSFVVARKSQELR